MNFEIKLNSIIMRPENAQDAAYIRDTLGLRGKGDSIPFTWVAVSGIDSALAYCEAKRKDEIGDPK